MNLFANWRTQIINSIFKIRNRSARIEFDCLKGKLSALVQLLIGIDDRFVFLLVFDPVPTQFFLAGSAVREIFVIGTS